MIHASRLVLALIAVTLLPVGCRDSSGPSWVDGFLLPPDYDYGGLAWDGSRFWMSAYERCIQVSIAGDVVSAFDGPGGGCGPLDWDGTHLWIFVADNAAGDGTIYRVTTQGEVVSSFLSPVDHVRVIVWDGTGLWLHGWVGDHSGLMDWYRVSSAGEILDEIIDPPLGAHGAAWDGQSLWCATHPSRVSGQGYSDLWRLSMSGEQAESHRFTAIQFWGMAFDGADFWVAAYDKVDGQDKVVRLTGF